MSECGTKFKRVGGAMQRCTLPSGHRGSCAGEPIPEREERVRELMAEAGAMQARLAEIRRELDSLDALPLDAQARLDDTEVEAITLTMNADSALRRADEMSRLPDWQRARLATLFDACKGIGVSPDERRTLRWLSQWEAHTVENVAAVIRRARAGGSR